MYIALRPIKFDREYLRGDHIDDDVVFDNVAQTLISAGYITYIDDNKRIISNKLDNKENTSEKLNEKNVKLDETIIADEVQNKIIEEELDERAGFTRETLESMTVSQLKELLTVNGIEFDKKSKKDDLVKAFLRG